MSNYLTKNLKQTCLYWGNSVADGYGGYTFDDPIEIDCRWEDLQELFIDSTGNEAKSLAVVFLDRDVVSGEYLMLGDLDDLSSSSAEPDQESNAKQIRSFKKIPNIKGTDYLRKVWL